MPSALSPIKSKRMEEKASLQSLNSRLESYVLYMKEVDDEKTQMKRELDTIRDRHTKEMASLRHRLTSELDETRRALEKEETLRMSLQKLEQEQNAELKVLRVQVQELQVAKDTVVHLQSELDKSQTACHAAQQQLQDQATLYQATQRELKELKRDHRSTVATLQDTRKELSHYKAKAEEVDVARDQEITKLRKEMTLKMQAFVAQSKKDHEESLRAIETENKAYYERMVSNLKSQLDDLTNELTTCKRELERTATEYEESLLVRQQLTDKMVQLEREYRDDRVQFTEQRRVLEAHLDKIREQNVRKECEFNELMDVKIALDQEISAYHRILDREETRVGLPTPKTTPQGKDPRGGRRRGSGSGGGGGSKRSHESMTESWVAGLGSLWTGRSKKLKQNSHGTAAIAATGTTGGGGSKKLKRTALDQDVNQKGGGVRISCLDLEKERIVLENTSDQDVALKGWQVCGRDVHTKFTFPDSYAIKPRGKVVVMYGKKHSKDELKGGSKDCDFFWTKKCCWNPQGDWVVLTNAQGVPVSTMAEGLSKEEVQALEEELIDDVDDNNAETCIVM